MSGNIPQKKPCTGKTNVGAKRRLCYNDSVNNTNMKRPCTDVNQMSCGVSQLKGEMNELKSFNRNELKKNTTDAIVKWVAKDILPFDVVSSAQFMDLAQLFINIGADNGRISCRDIIPTDRTVSKSVERIGHEYRELILPEVKLAISEGIMHKKDHKKDLNSLKAS